MYNQYWGDHDYFSVEPEPAQEQEQEHRAQPKAEGPKPSAPLLGEVTGSITKLLGGVFKHISPEKFDTGDILLVLIILFLFLEGDNLEIVITLGLMLLLGLGED